MTVHIFIKTDVFHLTSFHVKKIRFINFRWAILPALNRTINNYNLISYQIRTYVKVLLSFKVSGFFESSTIVLWSSDPSHIRESRKVVFGDTHTVYHGHDDPGKRHFNSEFNFLCCLGTARGHFLEKPPRLREPLRTRRSHGPAQELPDSVVHQGCLGSSDSPHARPHPWRIKLQCLGTGHLCF